jgi:2-dehydrotetronate isomerase
MFTEHAFLDRFAAAADAGFRAVEFLFPYAHPPEVIGERLRRNSLTQALFNLPPGDWAAGERGIAALPGRFADLQAGVETGLLYAEATGVARLHLMAGLADHGDPEAQAAYRRSVAWTAERVGRAGLDLVLEPINARNMPGYFLDDFGAAAALIAALNLPNLKLQFDLYHCQILHGDVTMRLRQLMPIIGHVQTASVPERHEPGTGEMNDAFLFAELDRLGYDGFVGCEYNPRAGTTEGLGWFTPYRDGGTAR